MFFENIIYTVFFNWYSGGGVQLGPLSTAATNRPNVPVLGDYDDGEIGGLIGKGSRSTLRKPTLSTLSTTNFTCYPGCRGGKPN
jgi:hypothetical protein